MRYKIIGIDASNIRAGGGVTHLSQLLAHAGTEVREAVQVVVWAGQSSLSKIESAPWIRKESHPWLERGLAWRLLWRQLKLPSELKRLGCGVLFAPGGALPWKLSVPAVTMSQNMLPFEPRERARFGLSWMRFKLALLWFSQSHAFRRAAGVIFLTEYAQRVVSASAGAPRQTALIAHGIESRFLARPRPQDPQRGRSPDTVFKLLYVSIIDVYKHQVAVAKAVAGLRKRGFYLTVEFVGTGYAPALKKLRSTMRQWDPAGEFLFYRGAIEFEALHVQYQAADGFVFASSCENLPNILIEAMSAGVPIACSNRGPMPEVLGEAGFYFDPEQISSIESAIERMVTSPAQRFEKAEKAFLAAGSYSWEKAASETFAFIEAIG